MAKQTSYTGTVPVRPLLAVSLMYGAQGIPAGLAFNALAGVLRHAGVPLTELGWVGLLFLPWALKFLWASLVDNAGKRWGYGPLALCTHMGAVVLCGLMAFVMPAQHFWLMLGGVFSLNTLFATQDILTNACAVSHMRGRYAGLANAVQVIAFLLGMVLGGAGTLLLYNKIGWSGAMLAMAAELMVLWVLLLPLRSCVEPDAPGMAYDRSRLRDLLQQKGFVWAAVVAVTFKFAGAALSMLVQPWLMDNAFSLDFAGTIQTVSLVGSAVGGALLGFPAVRWLGSRRAAFWLVFPSTALLGSVWVVQALGWAMPEVLIGCFSLESFFDGGFYVSIWAMLMNWSSVERPGTDYSVLQCGESLANVLAGFLVAPLASVLGYMPTFFGIWGVGAGLLGVLLLAVKKLATLCCDDQPHSNLHHTL
ncbi:MFS transporter [Acetobacter cibinongensis]|uniref:MFS transporter n=1 Tax=Acetobacter cibinongensis TaxID=146475 RepID=A0A0D6N5Y2_9PROT|nr:MFS transporter [Acetobacter cibinongensis]GAN61115.1 major facilitator superfamily transporter [Acetobacter cibinongensis]GBQ12664.1 major facilitator superfamily transporter [Acetobacter cibinongensis NRIC 0482]GEL58389.1 MFS transporter [Acetobacter cibinongensis]